MGSPDVNKATVLETALTSSSHFCVPSKIIQQMKVELLTVLILLRTREDNPMTVNKLNEYLILE